MLTEVMICPSPNPPTNKPIDPRPIEGATAKPPKPTVPATNPTRRLRLSLLDTVTPPRNAPQNLAIISKPLCESSISHCFASSGRIGPSNAVPRPASINPKCISPKEGACVFLRSINRPLAFQPLSLTQESARVSQACISSRLPCFSRRLSSKHFVYCIQTNFRRSKDLHHSRQSRLYRCR